MWLSRHPPYSRPLRFFELGWLVALSRDIKPQWDFHAVDNVILVIAKNGIGASHIYEELALARGANGGSYLKYVLP